MTVEISASPSGDWEDPTAEQMNSTPFWPPPAQPWDNLVETDYPRWEGVTVRRNYFSYYEFGLLAFNQQESERANLHLYRALDMTKCPKCQVSKASDVLLNRTAVVTKCGGRCTGRTHRLCRIGFVDQCRAVSFADRQTWELGSHLSMQAGCWFNILHGSSTFCIAGIRVCSNLCEAFNCTPLPPPYQSIKLNPRHFCCLSGSRVLNFGMDP